MFQKFAKKAKRAVLKLKTVDHFDLVVKKDKKGRILSAHFLLQDKFFDNSRSWVRVGLDLASPHTRNMFKRCFKLEEGDIEEAAKNLKALQFIYGGIEAESNTFEECVQFHFDNFI